MRPKFSRTSWCRARARVPPPRSFHGTRLIQRRRSCRHSTNAAGLAIADPQEATVGAVFLDCELDIDRTWAVFEEHFEMADVFQRRAGGIARPRGRPTSRVRA